MPQKRKLSLNRCYGIFFLVLTVLLGLAFLLQATDIYYSALDARETARADTLAQAEAEGWSEAVTSLKVAVAVNQIPIYSRAIVGERLMKLLPYICVWLAALVGAIVIATVHPASPADRHDPDIMLGEKVKATRHRLSDTPKEGREEDFRFAVVQYRHLHRQNQLLTLAVAVLAVLCLAVPLVYFANFSNFPNEDITGEVAAAVLYALPFVAVLLAGSIAYVYIRQSLLKKENAALKAAVAAGERKPKTESKKRPWLLVARCALLVIGLVLFIWGTQNGSMQEVLTKSIKICTECIGLG